jgi:nucleotide-binding universal stress UspA family protein
MFSRIIVATDGFDGGRDALALAATLAPDGALVLAHVAGASPPAAAAAYGRLLCRDARELLERQDADEAVEARPVRGDAASLMRLAVAERADLIVVGSSAQAPSGRVALCGAFGELLDWPPCAVAIASRGYQHAFAAPRLIGVGYDGSPAALRALAIAESLARDAGGEVRLRVVAEPAARALGFEEREIDAHGRLRNTLATLGVPSDGDVVVGEPGQALQSLSMQVDLLLTGIHGWRGCFRRLIPGSTAEWVARHAACPVVIAPPAGVREPAPAG